MRAETERTIANIAHIAARLPVSWRVRFVMLGTMEPSLSALGRRTQRTGRPSNQPKTQSPRHEAKEVTVTPLAIILAEHASTDYRQNARQITSLGMLA